MAKPDFANMVPILCIFQLLIKIFCHKINNWKIHKIGTILAKSGFAILFLLKFYLETTIRMSKSSEVKRLEISVLVQPRGKVLVLCACITDQAATNQMTIPFNKLGAVHKRRRQFLAIFDPLPPSYRPMSTSQWPLPKKDIVNLPFLPKKIK